MILLSLLSAFVPKEILVAVRVQRADDEIENSRHADPSEWRLRDAGDARIDDRSSFDRSDGDRGRSEFPTN